MAVICCSIVTIAAISGARSAFEAVAGQPIAISVKVKRADMPSPYHDAETFVEIVRAVCVPSSENVQVLGSTVCFDDPSGKTKLSLDAAYTIQVVMLPLAPASSLPLGSVELFWRRLGGEESCTTLALPSVAVKDEKILASSLLKLDGPAVAGKPFELSLWVRNNSDGVDEFDVRIITPNASDPSSGMYADMFDYSETSAKKGTSSPVQTTTSDFAILGPSHCRRLVHPYQSLTLSWTLVPLNIGDCPLPHFAVSSRRRKEELKVGSLLLRKQVMPFLGACVGLPTAKILLVGLRCICQSCIQRVFGDHLKISFNRNKKK